MQPITVTKADGTVELFDVRKLQRSLKKAGATPAEVNTIVSAVEHSLTDGITTQVIYRHAFELLRGQQTPVAARYSMRRALFGLGPTGFPFEDFLARLFEAEGYTTRTRIELKGKCATHELDVAAWNATDSFVVEAKFHAHPGVKSDLQVAMYSYARLLDLREQRICRQDICGIKNLVLATNTKFTKAAEKYAACSGLSILSWDYPKHNSLQDRIERAGIYPITALVALGQSDKRKLLENGFILCDDLVTKRDLALTLGIPSKKLDTAISESRQLRSR